MTRQRPTLKNKSCSDSCQQSCHANNWRNCMIGRLGLQLGEAHESSHTNPKKTTKLQTSQTNNTSAGQSILHKQHKSCRQHNKIWQRDSSACSSTFTLTDKETTSHSAQRRTLKRNRASRFLLDILSVRTELCDKSKAETRHVRALCERRGGWERACQETKSWLKLRGFVNWRSRQCSKKLALVQGTQICCVFTAPKLQSTTRELETRWSSCCSWFQRKFAGWIWSNRSWKRLLQQNPSFLLGICCLHWWKHNHPLFWLHFLSLSHDGLFVRESLDQVIPEIQKMSPVKVKQWVFVNLFLLFSIFDFVFFLINFWLLFFFSQFLTLFFCDQFLTFFVINFWQFSVFFFFADFPFGWIVDLTFVVTKWWTTFFVKEHRSTKLKQLESIFLLNIMANQQWTHTFLTFLVLWVNGLWPSTLQTLMTSKRRLLRTLSSPKLQWQKK